MNNDPQPITDYITNVLPHMEGWCTPEKALALAQAVLKERPAIAVEIGVFAGRSLIAMGIAMQTLNHGRLIGIDPWTPEASVTGFGEKDDNRTWWAAVNHRYIYDQAVYYTKHLGLSNRVQLVQATSEIAYPGLLLARDILEGPFIDFLHIDGNHSEECSVYDTDHYVPLVIPGGSVWFDDTDWNTTKPAQNHLETLCEKVGMIGTCGIYKRK